MKLFLLNLLLALLWPAINGTFSGQSLLVGFIVGYLVLLVARPLLGPSGYYTGVWKALLFAFSYVWMLSLSSIRVAIDVLRPGLAMRPGIVAVPLDVESDLEITALASLVTLTPGTLALDVSTDQRTLYVHAMYVNEDAEAIRRELKQGLEQRVLDLKRA